MENKNFVENIMWNAPYTENRARSASVMIRLCFLRPLEPSVKLFYVPPARKLVFSLHLTVAQRSILRYIGMKCKN